MAHSAIKAIFLATEDRPMAPLFGSNFIVQGKRILVSALGANFDRVDVLQALRELILDQNQLIVRKTAASEPLTLDVMNFEEIEAAIQFKAPNESSTILGDSLGEYNNLKAQYLSAINDQEQDGVLSAIKKLCFDATLENLASNALKGFGSFMHEPSGTRVFLLDNRKLYSFDQSRIRNISTAISRENARAAQIANQDEAKRSAEKPKAPKKKSKKQPKAKSASEEEEEPDILRYASSSSVSNPCEGAHTDSEDDHRQDGSVTPIMGAQLTNRLPTAPVFNAGSLFSSKQAKVDALEAKAQKKDKQKKHKKKERKQRVSKPEKSSKRDKRARTKKHKKYASRYTSSSSSSEDSDQSSSSKESSSEKNSSSEQVF